MTLKLPDTLTRLPGPERDMLIRTGLYEAVRARIRQLEVELAQCKEELHHFEVRYGMRLPQFEASVLANQDSLQVHEDYNDWLYWQSVLEEKQRQLADLQGLSLG